MRLGPGSPFIVAPRHEHITLMQKDHASNSPREVEPTALPPESDLSCAPSSHPSTPRSSDERVAGTSVDRSPQLEHRWWSETETGRLHYTGSMDW